MLDPGIWTDEGFLELSVSAKLFFIGLISHADDYGRGIASEKSLKAKIFPGASLPTGEIERFCEEVSDHMNVAFYQADDGSRFYSLTHWKRYQKVDRPSDSIIPPPPRSSSARRSLVERSSSVRPELVEEKEEKQEKGEKEQPPCQPAVDNSPPEEKKTGEGELTKTPAVGRQPAEREEPPPLCPNALPGGVICMKRLVWSPSKDEWFCPRADKGCGRAYPAAEWARKNGTVVPIRRKPAEPSVSPALAKARDWQRRKAEDPRAFAPPENLPDPFARGTVPTQAVDISDDNSISEVGR